MKLEWSGRTTRRVAGGPRVALVVLAALSVACGGGTDNESSSVRATDPRPNIVILFLDDAGYGDFGYTGNPVIRTPNIDRMAAEGTAFTQFYSASPACTASRYALLTGRLPVRSGFAWVLTPSSPRGMHPDEWTLAEGLREAGYATAAYGKWHLGRPQQYLPLQHGFDEYFGLPYSNDMQPPKWMALPLIEGNDVIESDPDQSTLTALYTKRAVDFIRRHREQPFFLYVPYAMPHLPLHPGAAFAGRSPRGTYGDVIEELDASVGEILATLRDEGIAENTLAFFTSDNGPWIIKNEEGGSSGPFRDGKGSTWEGGMREPGIAWWPGTVPAGAVDRIPASTMDLYVTALGLAGLPVPDDRPVDGQDIAARLRGDTAGGEHRDVEPGADGRRDDAGGRRPFFYYGPGNTLHAVRQGRWKLHVKTSSQTGIDYFDGALPLLFDLEQDPGEEWDLAARYPGVVDELLALIEAHRVEVARSGTFFDRAADGAPLAQGYTPTAAGAPSTDIYIAALSSSEGTYRVGSPRNITDRDGYDNQPAFEPGGAAMLYTSARDRAQTDIYRYDLEAGTTRQVTQTTASEFSATPLPVGGGFSAIHESADGQLLWRYADDGTSRGDILPDVQPVGYHAWGDEDRVIMFVLGGDESPATLQIGNLTDGSAEVIAENPGRSLHKVPGRHALSFVRKLSGEEWWIEVLDLDTMEFTRIGRTLPGREDYAWTPDGAVIMGDGSKLYELRPGEEWTEIADLSGTGIQDISRLAIDDSGAHIAIVSNR